MKQTKIEELDDRLGIFYSDVDTDSVPMPVYQSLLKDEHYSDEEFIAEGGMKLIFSVYDSRADRKVAIARPRESLKDGDIDSFLREARLTARLDHPNIIKVHEVGLDESEKPYFTMDLKTGHTLEEYLKTKQGNLQERLVIFLKICDAVSYAHSKGVLHLDLKPANIQIGEYGEVMVCDWGLGVISNNDSFKSDFDTGTELFSKATLNSHVKGTPGFMAPEQICKEELSTATDIFSLGAILYNLLTLNSPYKGNVKKILEETCNKILAPPSQKYPELNLPAGLDSVVLKAMQIDTQERYSSVSELALDINAYTKGFATDAEGAGAGRLFILMVKRNKAVFSVLAAAVIIISALTVLAFREIHNEKRRVVTERDKAVKLNEKYLEERNRALDLNEKYVRELTEKGLLITSDFTGPVSRIAFDKTLEMLEKAIKADETSLVPKREKAKLLFIMQRYNEAHELMKKVDSPLTEICEYSVSLKKDEKLSTYTLYQIIKKMVKEKEYHKLINKMLFYDQQQNTRPNSDRLLFVRLVLAAMNPGWSIRDIKFVDKERILTLKGKIKILENENFNDPTRFLGPLRIILIDTEIEDFSYFIHKNLKEIDIRGSKITALPDKVHKIKTFNKITLRKDQYKEYKNKPDSLVFDIQP